jgi:hypothetical protein
MWFVEIRSTARHSTDQGLAGALEQALISYPAGSIAGSVVEAICVVLAGIATGAEEQEASSAATRNGTSLIIGAEPFG